MEGCFPWCSSLILFLTLSFLKIPLKISLFLKTLYCVFYFIALVTKYPNKSSLGEKGFIQLRTPDDTHHCGEVTFDKSLELPVTFKVKSTENSLMPAHLIDCVQLGPHAHSSGFYT